jgi:hypothetical protein
MTTTRHPHIRPAFIGTRKFPRDARDEHSAGMSSLQPGMTLPAIRRWVVGSAGV